MNTRHNLRDVFPATGTEITAKSWLTEAPMRMLMNNLHPDVAENPHELVVYGGIGRAARTWEDFDRIVATLKTLNDDETLLVQSGKPVGVFRTHKDAPRVLIANSNLVPHWATWDHFNELDKKGLTMYGQMTAGSWIYIGTQGIVQGTYETFAEAGRQHYGGNLDGQMDSDRRPWRHGRRAAAGRGDGRGLLPCRRMRRDPDRFPHPHPIRRRQGADAGRSAGADRRLDARRARRNPSACSAMPPTSSPNWSRRMKAGGHRPDIVTDQTSAHDPLHGYLPQGWTRGRMAREAGDRPEGGREGRPRLDAHPCRGDGRFLERRRADARLRQQHPPGRAGRGAGERLRLPRLRARLYPPAVLPGHRPLPLVRAVGRSRRTSTRPTPR